MGGRFVEVSTISSSRLSFKRSMGGILAPCGDGGISGVRSREAQSADAGPARWREPPLIAPRAALRAKGARRGPGARSLMVRRLRLPAPHVWAAPLPRPLRVERTDIASLDRLIPAG